MASLAVLRHLRCWLVDHPAIVGFEWRPGHTFGASTTFVVSVDAFYLALILLIHRRLLPIPLPSPAALRRLSILHNTLLLLLSTVKVAGCALSAAAQMPTPRWLFCFPSGGATRAAGPVFFWIYVFYLSKLYEFGDTIVILLAGKGGRHRLTFLHVYHHATVVVMCYVWLATRQSLAPVAVVTNASVHVAMYAYYLSSSAGRRWPPRWKRAVTKLQIGQFVFAFLVSGALLYFHFAGGGCEGMAGWLFSTAFNASLLVLFVNFHAIAYKITKNAAVEARGGGESKKES